MNLSAVEQTQPKAVATLRTALEQDRLHHAYILVSRFASESSRLATALAHSLLCAQPQPGFDPCGTCRGCLKAVAGSHPDFFVLEPDEKQRIKIDAIRELTARLGLRASEAKTKVVIIHQAHGMNAAAQNALLKTLEEPPGPTCFLLCTHRYRSLLTTVRSRGQRMVLAPMDEAKAKAVMSEHLRQEGAPEHLGGPLAVLCGDDVEAAKGLLEGGAAEVLALLQEAAQKTTAQSRILDIAAELAADRLDLAMEFLALRIRDGLAHNHGAAPQSLVFGADAFPALGNGALAALADSLRESQARKAFNLNKTMTLETLLLKGNPTYARLAHG